MFITITKRSILIVLFILVLVSLLIVIPNVRTSTAVDKLTIVIDAGHGGVDGGTVGKKTGVTERDLNLVYAKELKALCEELNFNVVMTRNNEKGLYDPFSKNKKKDDMLKREKIIKNNNPDIIISLHMNSFSLPSSRGAQVFYNNESEESKVLANLIQEEFKRKLVKARENSLAGDYYILNCHSCPSVIIECGYLSNPEEEKLLISSKYKTQLCSSIVNGILNFLK